jgi:hypothetical protein
MNKSNKKMLLIFIIAIITAISMITAQATDFKRINIGDISYSYEGMAAEKAEQFVKTIFAEPDALSIQRVNILCLFGHSIHAGRIITVEHNIYPSIPRCLETIYSVEYCTRSGCDYFVTTGQTSRRIGCC